MRTALVLFVLLLVIYVLFSGRLRQVFKAVTGPVGSSAGAARPNIPGASPGQSGGGLGAYWRRIAR